MTPEDHAKLSVLDIISLEQLMALRAARLVVVHQVPTENMKKAGAAKKWPEEWNMDEVWHRMVAQSIREQNAALDQRVAGEP